MNLLINVHVVDDTNVGDLFSSPLKYFEFPQSTTTTIDIRDLDQELAKIAQKLQNGSLGDYNCLCFIVGGGGVLFPRFVNNFVALQQFKAQYQNQIPIKIITWGIGQQIYRTGLDRQHYYQDFDYSEYLQGFDLCGIRDFEHPNPNYHWVPCASCMSDQFDKPRSVQHEFVIFSHKKFEIKLDEFPRMTNGTHNFSEVLDFLGSGETILTSSYHGAYWGTLLGRKVLAFPFSSKFYTLKHPAVNFVIDSWQTSRRELKLLGKQLYDFGYSKHFSCSTKGWHDALVGCQAYSNLLQAYRDRSQWYYRQVVSHLS
ncbi:MAG: hypothetical protein O4861_02640 [Trichodesmium sp. St16_bin4-tuft]|nr:polysaccharide pyruvyl transferase family protein [Trichodesmium sp. MAG_R01]MDE5074327.1 hypothetical protein [Trichodesmium sp. St5_bin8]MDE5097289.1 hypothetical protein [Trichodesmium sp. St16_bin4-tuft]MDE5104389.1 hypothetical protein [Trichodesmium sp. St19_bin2]